MTPPVIQVQHLPSREERKENGIHYTPRELSHFLASQLTKQYLAKHSNTRSLRVLDPACGDGELLVSLVLALPPAIRKDTSVIGFDTNANAVAETQRQLSVLGLKHYEVHCCDFLSIAFECRDQKQLDLIFNDNPPDSTAVHSVDIVISNPPYVRTQILGSEQSRELARRFKLSGRVDLYHAFVIAMTKTLCKGGFIGLITSNRFLSTQAGTSLRDWLTREFRLAELIDLGDTKLFEAAVLPAIVIAEKEKGAYEHRSCQYTRIYEVQGTASASTIFESIFDLLSEAYVGIASVKDRVFRVEVGSLGVSCDNAAPWILTSDTTEKWIQTISKRKSGIFADYGQVCVGIKTTADKVFIRDDWQSLPDELVPEEQLLRNLVTHHIAERWDINSQHHSTRKVLYPYIENNGRRQPISLADYPRAARYLQHYRERLENRQYLIESGRQWYEIWVPHSPVDWERPKIAFPDISQDNTFFVVNPNWIVNGDCYWIAETPSMPQHALYAMLAVANSSFIVRFYDVLFHNKLYAGRRRFMCQYVKKFPFPSTKYACALSNVVSKLLEAKASGNHARSLALEAESDSLVWESFGLAKET